MTPTLSHLSKATLLKDMKDLRLADNDGSLGLIP